MYYYSGEITYKDSEGNQREIELTDSDNRIKVKKYLRELINDGCVDIKAESSYNYIGIGTDNLINHCSYEVIESKIQKTI